MTLGIVLPQGPRRGVFLMSEVPLYEASSLDSLERKPRYPQRRFDPPPLSITYPLLNPLFVRRVRLLSLSLSASLSLLSLASLSPPRKDCPTCILATARLARYDRVDECDLSALLSAPVRRASLYMDMLEATVLLPLQAYPIT